MVLQTSRYDPVATISPTADVFLGPNLSKNIPGRKLSPIPIFIMAASTSTEIYQLCECLFKDLTAYFFKVINATAVNVQNMKPGPEDIEIVSEYDQEIPQS